MHASARLRNLSRTVLVHLSGAALGGTLTHADDQAFNAASESAFVRVDVRLTDSVPNGHLSTDKAARCGIEVVAECYARTGEGETAAAYDAAEALAEAVADRLHLAEIEVVDYADTQATTGHYLTLTTCTAIPSPPTSGWARRIVSLTGTYFLRRS